MKKFFISKNYKDRFTASSKAKLDVERILASNGYVNIGLPAKNIQNRLLGKIYNALSFYTGALRMPKNGIFFMQFPVSMDKRQMKWAKAKGNRVVLIIHDLNLLRQSSQNSIEVLKDADLLIVHTPAMKKWIEDNNINKNIEVLQIFDYLDSVKSKIEDEQGYRVAFAGNLGKSGFLKDLKGCSELKYRLFGIGGENLELKENVIYCGCFPPYDLANHLDSHFGLVWDGDSLDECSGTTGTYLRYISPHKLSMYLSAGLPVIVWRQSAMAEFVENNKVGISVDSLSDIPSYLASITEKEYNILKKNAELQREKLGKGGYLSCILKKIDVSSL